MEERKWIMHDLVCSTSCLDEWIQIRLNEVVLFSFCQWLVWWLLLVRRILTRPSLISSSVCIDGFQVSLRFRIIGIGFMVECRCHNASAPCHWSEKGVALSLILLHQRQRNASLTVVNTVGVPCWQRCLPHEIIRTGFQFCRLIGMKVLQRRNSSPTHNAISFLDNSIAVGDNKRIAFRPCG